MPDNRHHQSETPPPGSRTAHDLSPSRFEQIEEIFQIARRLPQGKRDAYLAMRCDSDDAMRSEVESLLAQLDKERTSEFLAESAISDRLTLEDFARSQARHEPLPNRIGHYRIHQRIGEGGMGVVYLAEQESTGRKVALKVIGCAFGTPPASLLRRFEHEARLLGRLRHPGIAQVYEAGVHESDSGRLTPFIAMELVDGEPITEYAMKHELSHDDRLSLLVRVCRAVQHAHQSGVIHRDLKPANVLVDNGNPKIVDFGIARQTDSEVDVRDTAARTQAGAMLGTLLYMSPEQASGNSVNVDTRTDVYALGTLLYELLAGRPPHDLEGLKVHEQVRVICECEPARLGAIDRRWRGELSVIAGKALAKEPEQRYGSAEELARDIERFMHNEPILAHPPSAVYQFRKFARRNRSLVFAGCATVIILFAATVFSARQARRATEHQQVAESHFADANELARTLLFDIDASLVNVSGALPARRLLVERGLAYLDKVRLGGSADPSLLMDVAAGYVLIGDVQGDLQRPNLGDYDGALASYRTAVAVLEENLHEFPSEARPTLFLALNKIGDQLAHRNDPVGAIEVYTRSLSLAIEMADLDGEATAHERLANQYGALGRPALQQHHRDRYETITLEAIDRDPTNLSLRRNMAVSHFKRGMALLHEQPADALDRFQRYLVIVEELAAARPDDAVYQRDVAIGAQRVGNALEALGRRDEALAFYERELAILERLVAGDPENYQARAGRAAPCCKIGEHYLARGEFDSAMTYFERYLEIAESCAISNPADAAMQREVGVAQYKMMEWHAGRADDDTLPRETRRKHAEQAVQWIERCRTHFLSMRESDLLPPSDAELPEVLETDLASRREAAGHLAQD